MTPDRTQGPAQALRSRWLQLAPRERRLATAAATLALAAAVWLLALQPALAAWRKAHAERQVMETALQRMQALAAESAWLREIAPSAGSAPTAMRTRDSGLDNATRQAVAGFLGPGTRFTVDGSHVTVTFDSALPQEVRLALQTLRSSLKARLVEAELQVTDEGVRGRLRLQWLPS